MQKRYEITAYFLLFALILLRTVSAQSSNHVTKGRLFQVFRASPFTNDQSTLLDDSPASTREGEEGTLVGKEPSSPEPIARNPEASLDFDDRAYINVNDVNFDLDPTEPNQVIQIRLELALPYGSTPKSVKIGFPNSSSKWYGCRSGDSVSLWVCPVSGLLVSEVDKIRVIVD